jgi:hypothetical protein
VSVPAIDYTSKDFNGFKASLLDYASRAFPEWQSRSEGDFGVVLVELLSYMGDILSYYGDRLQAEAYLSTATQRLSILQIADLLGYVPANAIPAVGTVTFISANPGPAVVSIPAGTNVVTDYIQAIDGSITYETVGGATISTAGSEVTVPVVQGQTRSMTLLGTSSGLAAQQFRIPELPVITDSVLIYVSTGFDAMGNETTEEWTEISYLVDADAPDKVFATLNDEAGATWVQFGDNLNGAIPNNQLNIYSSYRIGGGVVGNIGAGLVVNIADPSVTNVSISLDSTSIPKSTAMTGGVDPESTDQIRANAPSAFRTQNRAVTLQDFIDTAIAVPGVIRANAVAASFTSVSVFIIGADGNAPSAVLSERVSTTLASKALAGCSVAVAGPAFIGVNVGATATPLVVQVYHRYNQLAVLYNVQQALRKMLSLSSVDFGMRLTVSDFYGTIMSVAGVQYVTIPMIARADATQSGTGDMLFRDWEIPQLGNLKVTASGGVS